MSKYRYNPDPAQEAAEAQRIATIKEGLRKGDRASVAHLLNEADKARITVYDYLQNTGLSRRTKFNAQEASGIILTYYRALGFVRDHRAADAWISPSEHTKIKLMARNLQIFKGSRGAWRKTHSLGLAEAALNIAQKANEFFGSEQAAKIAEHKVHQKEKAQERKDRAQQKITDDLYNFYFLSANMTPEQRSAWLVENIDNDKSTKDIVGEFNYHSSGNKTRKQVEGMFSINEPALFTNETVKRIETTIEVGGETLPLIFEHEENDRNIVINIGGLPINPLSMRVNFYSMGVNAFSSEKRGVVGYINFPKPKTIVVEETDEDEEGEVKEVKKVKEPAEPTAFLFMIIAGEKRKGFGRELIRAFCKVIRSYGLTKFISLATGEEGEGFLKRLHEKGEIALWGRAGSHWLVSCQDIYDHPGQIKLFGPKRKRKRK